MKALLFFLGCLAFGSLHAQNQFLIYSVAGNVSVIENRIESKARIGKMLDDKAQIKLSPDAKLTLICNEANLITLSRPGIVTLQELKSKCAASEGSLSANYVKYIWSQLTQKPGTPEKNRKQFMRNVGAVSRSVNNIWIDPRLDTLNYVQGAFSLSWKSYAEADTFTFSLYDAAMADKPVYETQTTHKWMPITQLKNHLKAGHTYYWTAAVKGETNTERKVLNVMKKNELDALVKDLSGATIDSAETEAAKAFRLGFLLEQAHYLAEAHTYYSKAASLQPGLEVYGTTLEAFRKDYSLTGK